MLLDLPALGRKWGPAIGLLLGVGAVITAGFAFFVARPIARAVTPLYGTIATLQSERKEDRAAIMSLTVAVAELRVAVAGIRYQAVPEVGDKVDVATVEAIATKEQLRKAADRNYVAVQTLTAKVDTLLRSQRRPGIR